MRLLFALAALMVLESCTRSSSGTANIMRAELRSSDEVAVFVDTCNATHAYELRVTEDAVRVQVTYTHDKVGDDCADGVILELPVELGGRELIDMNGNDVIEVVPAPVLQGVPSSS
jgi:hypothetical protein